MRTTLIMSLLIVFGFGTPAPMAQPANLGFEEGTLGEKPSGWSIPTPGYTATITKEGAKTGRRCALLAGAKGKKKAPFGNLMQSIDATAYRGKRVRLRAAVRAEVTGDENAAALWFRVDRPNKTMGFFDNMADRPIRDRKWKYYEIVAHVHPDAKSLNFGLMLGGDGRVWLDDVSLEPIGAADQGYLEGKPMNLGFEDGKLDKKPTWWSCPTPGYSAKLTEDNPKRGERCAVLASTKGAERARFGNLMQSVDATRYRGKRVRLRAAIRAEVSGNNRVQMWLRVDRPNEQMGFFDNMEDRPIRKAQWKYYEIVGDVARDADRLNFGLMLIDDGRAWLDDVSVEIVGGG